MKLKSRCSISVTVGGGHKKSTTDSTRGTNTVSRRDPRRSTDLFKFRLDSITKLRDATDPHRMRPEVFTKTELGVTVGKYGIVL